MCSVIGIWFFLMFFFCFVKNFCVWQCRWSYLHMDSKMPGIPRTRATATDIRVQDPLKVSNAHPQSIASQKLHQGKCAKLCWNWLTTCHAETTVSNKLPLEHLDVVLVKHFLEKYATIRSARLRDQSLRQPDLPIYRQSITSNRDIWRVLFM